MVRIAINGFGRIGRMVARAFMEQQTKDMQIVAINDLSPIDTSAHLFKYDSIHGTYQGLLIQGEDWLDFGAGKIQFLSEADPSLLPWKDLEVDIVLECSGFFTDKESASKHLKSGAKRVLISAPATNVDLTVVYGINHKKITAESTIVSNASCTTNCLAPIAFVLINWSSKSSWPCFARIKREVRWHCYPGSNPKCVVDRLYILYPKKNEH
jgi:glyceraldehyde 3-phosphate dehydrogenase